MKRKPSSAPLAILGAGPTGLEAALGAAEKGLDFVLYEAGSGVGESVRDWAHVRLFTPWSMNVSPRARRALEAAAREVPGGDQCPTGGELLEGLLKPLAELPQIAPHLRLGTRILGIGRKGLTKDQEIGTGRRAARPFRLLLGDAQGEEWIEEARAVLDCTGSYTLPNTVGDAGIPAPGEVALGQRIVRRVPDLDRERTRWAGHATLLVGAGHSAQTAARDLARLASQEPATRVIWALRREEPNFDPVVEDPLPERARLQAAAAELAAGQAAAVEVRPGRVVDALAQMPDGRIRATLRSLDGEATDPTGVAEEVLVDQVLALTGSVGDHQLYRQLQVHECYATSGPMKLAAALLASSGTAGDCLAQTSLGAETLKSPEPDFYILGSKSYGRNNSFLMRVGWEQVDEVMELLA